MPKTPKTRSKRKIEEVYYAFSIDRWKWDYSFSAGSKHWRPDEAYSDYRHLEVQGPLSRPRKSAGRLVNLTFVPSSDLLGKTAHLYQRRPEDVGWITWSRNAKAFDGTMSIPTDALTLLLPMLIAERLRFVILEGVGPFRGRLDVRGYRFTEALTQDHFPQDQW